MRVLWEDHACVFVNAFERPVLLERYEETGKEHGLTFCQIKHAFMAIMACIR